MKKIIKIVLTTLLFLACIWGAANNKESIGHPVCPGPQCGSED